MHLLKPDQKQQQLAQRIVERNYDIDMNGILIHQHYNRDPKPVKLSPNLLRRVLQLIDSKKIPQLTIGDFEKKSKMIDILLEAPFDNLEGIGIYKTDLSQVELKKLVQKEWTALKKIRLHDTNIGNKGLEILLTKAKRLESLQLLSTKLFSQTGNSFDLSSLKVPLAIQPANLRNLKKLSIKGNKLGLTGVQYLVKGNLPSLEDLELTQLKKTSPTDSSIKHLSKGHWPNLVNLRISRISTRGMSNLEGANWKLTTLGVIEDKTDKKGLSIHHFSIVTRFLVQKQLKLSSYQQIKMVVKGILQKANVEILSS